MHPPINDGLNPIPPTRGTAMWAAIGKAGAVAALAYYSLGIADHAAPWVRELVAWATSIVT